MVKPAALVALVLVLASVPLNADDNVCPCVPLSHEWIATSCETWNCAQAALILANGDPYVFAVPTASTTWKWVVLRRVVSGSFIPSADEPFVLEQFEGMPAAVARFSALDHDTVPMLMSMTDGKAVVLSLRAARRRPSSR